MHMVYDMHKRLLARQSAVGTYWLVVRVRRRLAHQQNFQPFFTHIYKQRYKDINNIAACLLSMASSTQIEPRKRRASTFIHVMLQVLQGKHV